MKGQPITPGKKISHKVDKRDLVNIDLYNHEIKVIEDQLNREAEKHNSKEIHEKHSQLKKELIEHKQKLERLRKSCELQQDNYLIENLRFMDGKSFFEKLKAFEENFKNTRNNVNEFLR